MVIRRFDIHLVRLDPTVGREIQKTRPCLIVSPDELNQRLETLLIAPMTSRGQPYPWRVACRFRGKPGQIAIDQMRTVDRGRLIRRLGSLDRTTAGQVLTILQEMFAP